MRKLVLTLFLAMLPLQWTAAAVASLCLPDAQAMGSVQAHVSAQADAAVQVHDHTPDSPRDSASRHHGARDREHDGKAPHTDHGGCCHATASALPIRLAIARMQPVLGDLVSRMTVLAVSHASDSPFRPPRLALA